MRTKLYLLTAFLLLAGLASAQHVIGATTGNNSIVTAQQIQNTPIPLIPWWVAGVAILIIIIVFIWWNFFRDAFVPF
jgi:hypothetical protein